MQLDDKVVCLVHVDAANRRPRQTAVAIMEARGCIVTSIKRTETTDWRITYRAIGKKELVESTN